MQHQEEIELSEEEWKLVEEGIADYESGAVLSFECPPGSGYADPGTLENVHYLICKYLSEPPYMEAKTPCPSNNCSPCWHPQVAASCLPMTNASKSFLIHLTHCLRRITWIKKRTKSN